MKAPSLSLADEQTVTLKVQNVNQILYTYSMSCTAKPTESPASLFAALFTGVVKSNLESPDRSCESEIVNLKEEIQKYYDSPAGEKGAKPKSITIENSRTKLASFRDSAEKLKAGACAGNGAAKAVLESAVKNINELLERPDFVAFEQVIAPDHEYLCTVQESHKGEPTEGGTLRISVNPSNSIATLSVGALASAVPTRSFEIVNAPNADNTGGMNVLGVQGDSMSGHVAALINFRLPMPRELRGDDWGIDATFGPAFRVGSSGNTSSVGFFAGLSLRLYRYLFITPGVHLAPVADYPIGFSQPGQVVPPNFGTPTPIRRTTARFGLAISVQTKNFGSLGNSRVTSLPILPPTQQEEPQGGKSEGAGEGEGDKDKDNETALKTEWEPPLTKQQDGAKYVGTLKITNPAANSKTLEAQVRDLTGAELSNRDKCKSLAPGKSCQVGVSYTKPTDFDPNAPPKLIVDVIEADSQTTVEVVLELED